MSYKLKCRDYLEGECFPYIRIDGIDEDKIQECDNTIYDGFSPESIGLHADAWDTKEFNQGMILNGERVRVRSCHFDYIHTKEQ